MKVTIIWEDFNHGLTYNMPNNEALTLRKKLMAIPNVDMILKRQIEEIRRIYHPYGLQETAVEKFLEQIDEKRV